MSQQARLRKRSHSWIDARSLEMARAIAEKVRADPSLMEGVRWTLGRWKETLRPWPQSLKEWERIIETQPLGKVLEALLEDTEEGRRRRQSSPFAGILSPAERKAILDRYETIGA